ncbi:40S ribosomal protein S7 [Ixodes scapularis]
MDEGTKSWRFLFRPKCSRKEARASFYKMYSANAKIVKPRVENRKTKPGTEKREEITKLEESVSQALLELEMNSDLKAQLRELHFVGAKEVEVKDKKAILVYVPVPLLKKYQKIQARLVRELEKKFSGQHVVFLARRVVLAKPTRKSRQTQKRPRSRTLTAVHDALLEDLVFPAEIVGKRVRVRLDASRLIKVHLERSQQTNIEHKLDTFSAVYKNLTGKEVTFEFRDPPF